MSACSSRVALRREGGPPLLLARDHPGSTLEEVPIEGELLHKVAQEEAGPGQLLGEAEGHLASRVRRALTADLEAALDALRQE
eukprot:12150858-Alexandrium_andersonii.AAC.1